MYEVLVCLCVHDLPRTGMHYSHKDSHVLATVTDAEMACEGGSTSQQQNSDV